MVTLKEYEIYLKVRKFIETIDCDENNLILQVISKQQASKHYYLLTQVGLWQLFKAGVDLRLGCPQSDILEQISLGTHLSTPRGWTAELAGGCCKQFR